MSRFAGRRPSPAMIVAGAALIVALAGTAIAAPLAVKSVLDKQEKKQVKKIAKNQVNKLAPGLSVANAGRLDNIDSAGFVQVKQRVFEAVDTTQVSNYPSDTTLLTLSNLPAGQWVIQAATEIDQDTAGTVLINCDLEAPTGTDLDSRNISQPNGRFTHVLIGQFTASAAGTDVVIRCTSDGNTDASDRKIIATLVNN